MDGRGRTAWHIISPVGMPKGHASYNYKDFKALAGHIVSPLYQNMVLLSMILVLLSMILIYMQHLLNRLGLHIDQSRSCMHQNIGPQSTIPKPVGRLGTTRGYLGPIRDCWGL